MNLLSGGFGKVKVAKNKKTGKYVALKLLNKG
jgi:serine/threonine protein kinase